MRTIEYKVSFEKMITRLPGLFAYLDSDEFGNVILHKATDSLDGCYGKIVENIKLPVECECYNPLYKKCYRTDCFSNRLNPMDVITMYEYQELPSDDEETQQETQYTKESYQILEEPKLISETEYEDLSQDEKMFYEMIYVNINNNDDIKTMDEYEGGKIKGGETYTFRTLITYYYDYKDYLPEDNDFKKFIEEGIGKVKVTDLKLLEFELVPKFVYLSNVRNLYNQYVKLHKQCELYNQLLENGEQDVHLCCLCEKYEKMGGDAFMNFIKDLIPQADEIAEKYFGYAESADKSMNLEFSVDLVSSYDDMGIMSTYAPQWLPYVRYYEGDKVVYDGKLYICTNETTGMWDENLQTVVFDNVNFIEYEGAFLHITNDEPDEEFQVYNYREKVIGHEGEIWYDGSAMRHVAQRYDIGKKVLDFNVYKTNDEIDDPCVYLIRGKTDSKLRDLRRFATYVDLDNTSPTPQEGYDWLFYYRKGKVLNMTTRNDELGNILDLTTGEAANSSQSNLAAYGDVIENIIADENEPTITFVYRLGVHLMSESEPTTKTDDDGNTLYYWEDDFKWDGNEKIGIKYEETYNYVSGGELDDLINGNIRNLLTYETIDFNDYTEGIYDISLQYYKFEFITFDNTINYRKTIANQEANITSIITDLEVNRLNYSEFTESELFREEFLNGITYNPTRDIDVKIERGSTSVFEKNIALSEIKTLEDLENYKNGAFFTLNNI